MRYVPCILGSIKIFYIWAINPMITNEIYQLMKKKYQFYSSWAIWAEEGEKPKSNVGDLSVLNPAINQNLLNELNPNIILVALNISRGDIQEH